MYVINILLTVTYSAVCIVGSILTGKIPKGSFWQLNKDVELAFIKDFWDNEDFVYRWLSRDVVLKDLHSRMLDNSIDALIDRNDEVKSLSSTEINRLKQDIKSLVLNYKRTVL